MLSRKFTKDFFDSEQECKTYYTNTHITNPRYKTFTQTYFTAGDTEQFTQYCCPDNGDWYDPVVDMNNNIYKDIDITHKITWDKYKDIIDTNTRDNTFKYIFHKFKKGIFIKIQNNKLRVFLPFSKHNFTNDYAHLLLYDPDKYTSMTDFICKIGKNQGYNVNPKSINRFTNNWVANNCLVRYEFPLLEGDSGIMNIRDMFETLCKTRTVPDMEFFVNKRDFPLIKRDGTEAYEHIWNGDDIPLTSHNYEKYLPILGCCTTDRFADVPMPTWEDWQRVNPDKFFPKSCRDINIPHIPWQDKYPIAVFRGSSTGAGVTMQTNPRLLAARMSHDMKSGEILLDAGITKWNTRPRKLRGEKYLQTIDISTMPPLVPRLTPAQQAQYKYILDIDGHTCAYRLPLELSYGSVILLVESPYKLWITDILQPFIHYIPIKSDLSNLVETILWCRSHDEKCKEIASNAKKFYENYLHKDACIDYLQKILVQLKQQMGVYCYNSTTPLDIQLKYEYSLIKKFQRRYYHNKDIFTPQNRIPPQHRSYSLLRGITLVLAPYMEFICNQAITRGQKIYNSRRTMIYKYDDILSFPIIVKLCQNRDESIHEIFTGFMATNNLLQDIPNFSYILGFSETSIVMEYIQDSISFFDYLKSSRFNMEEYILIIIQIILSLIIAQRRFNFIHWDLMPWNIMIQYKKVPEYIEYGVAHDKVFTIKTRVIPIIIDYGKSHTIINDKHHGYINMYKYNKMQDLYTLLVSSAYEIIKHHQQSTNDLLYIFKYISHVKTANDLRRYVQSVKRFSSLVDSTYKWKQFSYIDFIQYIMGKWNTNDIFITDRITRPFNIGHEHQVYSYIMAKDDIGRKNSYTSIFENFKPITNGNMFSIYYGQYRLRNLLEVCKDVDREKYKKCLCDLMVKYSCHDNIPCIPQVTEHQQEIDDTMYGNPYMILDILENTKHVKPLPYDIRNYYHAIVNVILTISDSKIRDKFIEMIQDIDVEKMTCQSADITTLRCFTRQIYQKNIKQKNIPKPYKKLYKKILFYFYKSL